jgi:pathogenesis-related protein 1
MSRALRSSLLLTALAFIPACSDDGGPIDLGGTGGANGNSGGAGSGGLASGGTSTGGLSGTGGLPSSGGLASTGGSPSGGAFGSGAAATGGGESTGGDSATGGTGSGGEQNVDCTFVPDPALAVGETGNMVGVTAAHNEWRLRAGVPPVRWNDDLAAGAQAYADTCPSGHSSNEYREDVAGFAQVGENLYSGTDVLNGIALFADERLLYDFGTEIDEETFTPIGHYTQMVWSDTTHVGCAVGNCGMWRTVCWYGPAGNYIGEVPYDESEGACLDLDNDDVFQFEDADDTDREVD